MIELPKFKALMTRRGIRRGDRFIGAPSRLFSAFGDIDAPPNDTDSPDFTLFSWCECVPLNKPARKIWRAARAITEGSIVKRVRS